jgi:hypothetical protein
MCTFAHIAYFMIGIGIWIIVPMAFLIGGVMFMISRGDPGAVSRARAWLTNAVWGVVIMLCAWLIVATFISFLGNFTSFTPYFGGTGSQITVGGQQC